MYAIIRAGGHQEKVTVGETILVDRIKQDPGSEITFVPLMVSGGGDGGDVVTDHKQLADGAMVVGRVVDHVRGDKIDVFQYRNKTGYRRHIGHRSMLTRIEIAEIRIGDRKTTLDDAKAAKDKADADRAEQQKAVREARDKAKAERAEKKKAKSAKAGGAAKAPAKTAAKKTAAKKTAAKKK